MSLMSKTVGLGATVALIAAGLMMANLGSPSSYRRGVIPAAVRPGAEVRLFVAWQRPYTPTVVKVNANDGSREYRSDQLAALIGHQTWIYAYQPGVVYTINAMQESLDAKGTMCQIVVDGKQIDHDSRDGVGLVGCVAHG